MEVLNRLLLFKVFDWRRPYFSINGEVILGRSFGHEVGIGEIHCEGVDEVALHIVFVVEQGRVQVCQYSRRS